MWKSFLTFKSIWAKRDTHRYSEVDANKAIVVFIDAPVRWYTQTFKSSKA